MTLIGSQAQAQDPAPVHGLQFDFTRNGLDKSLNLHYLHFFGRHGISGGMKYHLWWYGLDQRTYTNNGHATSIPEHFGLNLGYRFYIKSAGTVQAFVFFDTQISRLAFQWENYSTVLVTDPTTGATTEQTVITKYHSEPCWTAQNNVGFGLDIYLGHNIYLNEMIGLGVAKMWFRPGERLVSLSGGYEWIAPFGRLGLAYRF